MGELLLRTQHAREMWITWVKCRILCDRKRASAGGTAQRLMDVGSDIFRECIKRVWGPMFYEATMWQETLPMPAEASVALSHLREVANDDFKEKWKLETNNGETQSSAEDDNVKLQPIWKDFRESCPYDEHLKMIALMEGKCNADGSQET